MILPRSYHEIARRLWQGGNSFTSKVTDLIVLLALASVIAWFLDRNPQGWLATNPTLLLVVPLLMGGRYGFLAGLISGLAAAAAAGWQTSLQTGGSFGAVLDAHLYTLAAFPLTGVICGEVQSFFYRALLRAEVELDYAGRRLRFLNEEALILEESKDELDRTLALLDADMATLDFEIRRLLHGPDNEIYLRLLGVLSRKARVQEGAIYVPSEPGAPWQRDSWIGSRDRMPLSLTPEASKVAALALRHKAIASLPMVWSGDTGEPGDFLFACPLMDLEGTPFALLVVAEIPFVAMKAHTLQTVELICRWAAWLLSLRLAPQTSHLASNDLIFVPPDKTSQALDVAWDTWHGLQIPSSLVMFCPDSTNALDQSKLEGFVAHAMRFGDLPLRFTNGEPHLLLLLPLTGRLGAEACRERFLESARADGYDGLQVNILAFDEVKSRSDLADRIHTLTERRS